MAISFVGAGTPANGTGGVTPLLPAGLQDGDLLIFVAETIQTQTVPAYNGYTDVTGSPITGSDTRLTVRYKFASGETNVATGDPGNHIACHLTAWRGVDPTTPINAIQTGTATASTTLTATGVTTTVDGCEVVVCAATGTDTTTEQFSGWANANLTGIAERNGRFTSSGTGGGCAIASGTKASAGATGNTTASIITSAAKAFVTFALQPSVPVPAHENLVDTFEHDTTGATNLSSGSISVESGDLLVVKGAITGGGAINTPTASGLTFTLRSDAAASESVPRVSIWSATCPSTTSVTVTATTSSNQKAFIVEQWRDMHLDVSPAIIDAGANPVPDQTITTEAADSVVTWIVSDWNEGAAATPTYDGDGTTCLDFAEQYSGAWTWWAQHTYDLGTAGSKAISWSAPTSIDGSFAGLELLDGPADTGVAGTLAADLPALTADLAAAATATGTVTATLPALTASLTGLSGDQATGTVTATLPALTSAWTGTVTATGTIAANLPELTGALTGTITDADITGTLTATLPEATGTATGAITVAGILGSDLPAITAAAAATATATGNLDGSLPALVGDIAAQRDLPPETLDITFDIGPSRVVWDVDPSRLAWNIDDPRLFWDIDDARVRDLATVDATRDRALAAVVATRTSTDIGASRLAYEIEPSRTAREN